jgi:mono/diheme cytochrome c family protein
MAVSPGAIAYGAVAVVAGILLVIGTPSSRSAAIQTEGAASRPTPAYVTELRKQVASYVAVVGPHAAPATAATGGITLRSVGFDFPASDRGFPAEQGADLLTNNCTACHSAGMILNQPPLTRTEWTGEVNKMLHTYKAPIQEADVPGIVAYLASLKPTP